MKVPLLDLKPQLESLHEEIIEAVNDYNRTQFGGWPWEGTAPTHGSDPDRFARHADGRVEKPI